MNVLISSVLCYRTTVRENADSSTNTMATTTVVSQDHNANDVLTSIHTTPQTPPNQTHQSTVVVGNHGNSENVQSAGVSADHTHQEEHNSGVRQGSLHTSNTGQGMPHTGQFPVIPPPQPIQPPGYHPMAQPGRYFNGVYGGYGPSQPYPYPPPSSMYSSPLPSEASWNREWSQYYGRSHGNPVFVNDGGYGGPPPYPMDPYLTDHTRQWWQTPHPSAPVYNQNSPGPTSILQQETGPVIHSTVARTQPLYSSANSHQYGPTTHTTGQPNRQASTSEIPVQTSTLEHPDVSTVPTTTESSILSTKPGQADVAIQTDLDTLVTSLTPFFVPRPAAPTGDNIQTTNIVDLVTESHNIPLTQDNNGPDESMPLKIPVKEDVFTYDSISLTSSVGEMDDVIDVDLLNSTIDSNEVLDITGGSDTGKHIPPDESMDLTDNSQSALTHMYQEDNTDDEVSTDAGSTTGSDESIECETKMSHITCSKCKRTFRDKYHLTNHKKVHEETDADGILKPHVWHFM